MSATAPRHGPGHEDRFGVARAECGSRSLRACVAFEPGDVLTEFRCAELLTGPARHTVQVGAAAHALIDPECLRYTNHSCDPNVVLDTSTLCVRAIRRIEPGEEITYFYPSTEWRMAEAFRCGCGSPRCLGHIAGAEHLPAEVAAGYQMSGHIEALLEARGRAAAAELPHQRSTPDADG